ncbi:acyl-CoA ligase (AMP-forming), exosortase A system-associated [Undibacterium sp. TJN25]|uniref:acyl-CoA ligase (AMP-forming), exosortase A system-associated n=1 Tax=Undibacterium sp. TJN25 TaxID=3413056 RepID=UPI003BF400AD
MTILVHELIAHSARRTPDAEALCYQAQRLSYTQLQQQVTGFAGGLLAAGTGRSERVAVYLEKRIETVVSLFGASAAGAVFVPVNPLLKPDQLAYIVNDCNVSVLVTSADRLAALAPMLESGAYASLHTLVIVGSKAGAVLAWQGSPACKLLRWEECLLADIDAQAHYCVDSDVAAILYTSGSTGRPKGVVLSHRNLLAGAQSVVQYLGNTAEDRILAVLPLSFDYGLSQLTTAFLCGATAVLINYLLPRDVVTLVSEERITGLAAVPPLWIQLAQQKWPADCTLRYLTNSGGAMQRPTLQALRTALPAVQVYLMYGLTEAFRSTYLSPSQLDARPDSMGKAIPNAEILVLKSDGSPCAPGEPGELVHRGALVSLGYWNDVQKTAERFRPLPAKLTGLPFPEIAVWSGDTVRMDEDGYLYFIGREDDMIKVSGYRISPTEVEEVIYSFPDVEELAAVGVPHPQLGQAIVAVIRQNDSGSLAADTLRKECQRRLPAYMVPAHIEIDVAALPRNPNGKIDRKALQLRFARQFESQPT